MAMSDLPFTSLDALAPSARTPVSTKLRLAGALALGTMGWLGSQARALLSQSGDVVASGSGNFTPKDGVDAVRVRPGLPAPAAALAALGQHKTPACLFWHSKDTPHALADAASTREGLVYGARWGSEEQAHAMIVTGQQADVVKGRLLCWPEGRFADKLQAADAAQHCHADKPQHSATSRGVCAVVAADGSSTPAYCYFQAEDSSAFWAHVLRFAQQATDAVGKQILQENSVRGQEKEDGSVVTQCDVRADAELRRLVAHTFPHHGVLSEEAEHVLPPNDYVWIIDPIDGTTNFANGLPIWGISLGLLFRGTPVFGLGHFPALAITFHGFWAGRSGLDRVPTGAFINGHRATSSREPMGKNQFFNLCARSTAILAQPGAKVPAKVRMLGSTIYSYLAVAGGISMAAVEATPKIWDIAGVWPVVMAAGAVWQPLHGSEPFPLTPGKDYGKVAYPTLVVARPDVLPAFLPLVQVVAKKA
eukprot:g73774.t1